MRRCKLSRSRKRKTAKKPAEAKKSKGWDLEETPSAKLVEIQDVERLEATEVAGAFVKVAPALEPAAARVLDARAVRAGLEKRGAVAVVVSPRIVSPAALAEAAPDPDLDLRVALRDWIARQVGSTERARAAATELVLQIAEEVGL